MKTGSLVKRIDNWVKFNPWMGDTLMSDKFNSNEVYGIVLHLPNRIVYKSCIKVLWATLGVMLEHPDDIELIQ